jgi:hypothetical protein
MKNKRHHHRQKESNRKSRSLEHILDSSSNSSNSTYKDEIISRCPDNANTFRAYMDSPQDFFVGKTGTMRSCRSIASCKSVTIHPQVTEYHYSDGEEEEKDKEVNMDFTDVNDVIEEKKKDEAIMNAYEKLPSPIYPALNGKTYWKSKINERRKSFGKDQIIDFY